MGPGKHLRVNNGSGSGQYVAGTMVSVAAGAPPAGQKFSGWIGDTEILANPFTPTTSATMPSMDVAITATYSGPQDRRGRDRGKGQPVIEARVKAVLTVKKRQFKDLNGNNKLDPYEDWRLAVETRVEDLLSRMTREEKAGMMLIDTLNADVGGVMSPPAEQYINDEHMTRFIFRNPVVPNPDGLPGSGIRGAQITPREAAEFMNRVQEEAEATPLGIPLLFKSNARNHYEQDARPGINVAAGSFSEWPKEAGLAATRNIKLIREFGNIMAQEWTAIGLRGMYGYMADLSTEPRWYRVHETFTEDADLAADIITALVETLQGKKLNSESVALTIKHFPGGGPQEGGGDPHYYFGRNQAYPADNFDYHLIPFEAAIDAGAASIMAYYGIPVGQRYLPNDVGMAFSKGIVTQLLRDELGFEGYVNSDTGIIGTRAWGLQDRTLGEQITIAVEAGTDVLSGFHDHAQIINLVNLGMLRESRLNESVRRLLKEQFELGLFENPYVDPERAAEVVGNAEFQKRADLAQRKSIVLLQNKKRLLPLPRSTATAPIILYTMGMDAETVRAAGYTVTAGDHEAGTPLPPVPAGTNFALIRVNVSNPITAIRSANPGEPPTMADPREPPPQQTIFGGAAPHELNFLAFSDMVGKESWVVTPSLADIKAVMAALGPDKTVLSIYFRQPFVLDEASGMRNAGAIVGLFGVNDAALMDLLTGKFKPRGKLPFALANSAEAIVRQAPDAPGYPLEDTLYPFGFGLTSF